MLELFKCSETPTALKFTAVLAAFAHLDFPVRLSSFRALIPDEVWAKYLGFTYTNFIAGFVPIFWEEEEWFYSIRIGPGTSSFGLYTVYFVGSSAIGPNGIETDGEFDPPLNAKVSRFTLCHPFLKHELHDPTGIYLYKGG